MIPNDNGIKINYLITISLNTETEDPNFYTSTCTFINTFQIPINDLATRISVAFW